MKFGRIQFTPDMLPADITGMHIYSRETERFEWKEGPVFTNVLLADEINRATPRTQAGLLECMEERQVTVDAVSYTHLDVYKRQQLFQPDRGSGSPGGGAGSPD